jgi:hypothetical protein
LQKFGIKIHFAVAHLWHFFNKGAEDGSELVVYAGVWSVLPDAYHSELLVEEETQCEGASDHLAASFVETAIDLYHVLHILYYLVKE